MILYRVEHRETGMGPFSVTSSETPALWEDGPTPQSEARARSKDDYASVNMTGRVCGVHRPHLLPKWFREPRYLGALGLVLTVWDVPDDFCQAWKFQAVFNKGAATLIRTVPLPERWEDILDILSDL